MKQFGDPYWSVLRTLPRATIVLRNVAPIQIFGLGNKVSTRSDNFLPILSTEAAPRVISVEYAKRSWLDPILRSSRNSRFDAIVWDERYTHYVNRLIDIQQALAGTETGLQTCVHAVSAIGWDYVVELLSPGNRRARIWHPCLFKRVQAGAFCRRLANYAQDDKLLSSLTNTPLLVQPDTQRMLKLLKSLARQLTFHHELYHFIRLYPGRWDGPKVDTSRVDEEMLSLFYDVENTVLYGDMPPKPVWPYFERIFFQLPLSMVRHELMGSQLGEEVQCDLFPILLLCKQEKRRVSALSEVEEFVAISHVYNAIRSWQLASCFLQGIRNQISQLLGSKSEEGQEGSLKPNDLGLRLLLGNLLAYKVLASPPYSNMPTPPDWPSKVAVEYVERARREASQRHMNGGNAHYQHRVQFLSHFEDSSRIWIYILNRVGIDIAEKLQETQSSTAPAPRFDHYISIAWRDIFDNTQSVPKPTT